MMAYEDDADSPTNETEGSDFEGSKAEEETGGGVRGGGGKEED